MGSLYRRGGLVFAKAWRHRKPVHPPQPLPKGPAQARRPARDPFPRPKHTCATLLLPRNVNPKIVSEMLGHASIAITLGTYSHVLPNMQQSDVRALEATFK